MLSVARDARRLQALFNDQQTTPNAYHINSLSHALVHHRLNRLNAQGIVRSVSHVHHASVYHQYVALACVVYRLEKYITTDMRSIPRRDMAVVEGIEREERRTLRPSFQTIISDQIRRAAVEMAPVKRDGSLILVKM